MLSELLKIRADDSWVLVSHRGLHPLYADVASRKNVTLDIDSSRLGPLWIHVRLPFLLKKHKADILWGTLAMLPVFFRRRCRIPAVVNFHDLNAYSAPDTMVLWNRLQHRLLASHTLRNADRVLCLSKTTRDDILKFIPSADARKLDIVYPGCELPAGESRPPGGDIGALEKFSLCVGTIEPRKNQKTLIEAQSRAFRENSNILPLVIVGRRGWGDDSLYEVLRNGSLKNFGIFFLESASGENLQWCYEHAAWTACPSIHEGFGLPIIESLKMNIPVMLSDIPVFREVGGDSRFVSCLDPESWKTAILEFNDQHRSGRLKASKLDTDWSWKTFAAQISTIIDETIRTANDRQSQEANR